ncbi:MAG: flap endonuclease [Deltaproteobacteria bacterium]|nr:flap endonuclease [Deltaproteobacteria bacterium]
MRRVHLVDGTYELFRAHFSKRPDRPRKATVGVVGSLIGLLHDPDELPTHVAVAFDNPIRSFRNDLFAGYKSDEGVPPELRAQFDAVEEAVAALGVTVWSMVDHEADDALASGARRFRDAFDQVRILTPDKDLGQSVIGTRVVQVDRMRKRVIDEDEVVRARGVHPESIPDLLALIGDDADGIPGIPGWGAVSAGAVLAVYRHLEDIPADPSKWTAKVRSGDRLAAAPAAQRGDALLYRRLATLVDDLPLVKSEDDVAFRGVPRERFLEWCAANEVSDLRDRPTRWL